MILEVAILNVVAGKEKEFETAFSEAKKIISSSKGFINYQLQKCIEINNQYILLVNWQTLEDHIEGFRKSEAYKEWKKLLHHFYEPFPKVEHYSTV
jgi:heme-degrading monooxygenase HmoA